MDGCDPVCLFVIRIWLTLLYNFGLIIPTWTRFTQLLLSYYT